MHLQYLPTLATTGLPLAAMSYHVLRKHETNSIITHATLLFGLPGLLTAYFTMSKVLGLKAYGQSETPPFQVTLMAHLATILVFIISYRLSPFHPLARYPGPILNRLSMFIPASQSITGEQIRLHQALHKKYGSIVRIGPNQLSIADPALISTLLGSPGVPKGQHFTGGSMSETKVPMVGIEDMEEHLRRRRAWSRGLSRSAIKEYEHSIIARAKQLVRRLEEQHGVVILGKWLSYFSYDFILDMAFGGGSELLRDGDHENVWLVIEKGMIAAKFLSQVPWLGIYVGYIPGVAGPLNTLMESGRQLAAQRLARGSTIHDLFYYLNNEDLPEHEPPPASQLVDDGVLAVNAGSDTTSVAMTSILFCILANAEVYQTLQEEIDEFYGQDEDPYTSEQHRNMQYLQAVINEALRLYPPTPGGTQRRVPPHGPPVVVGSLCIPPGTSFYMPPFTMHRDARNFIFPENFWPERWLIASGKLSFAAARLPSRLPEQVRDTTVFVHNDAAFIPFSYGPMNCPGKGLAMLAIQTVVCALLHRFRIRLAEGWDPRFFEREYKDYFTATRPELPVTLEKRW